MSFSSVCTDEMESQWMGTFLHVVGDTAKMLKVKEQKLLWSVVWQICLLSQSVYVAERRLCSTSHLNFIFLLVPVP